MTDADEFSDVKWSHKKSQAVISTTESPCLNVKTKISVTIKYWIIAIVHKPSEKKMDNQQVLGNNH